MTDPLYIASPLLPDLEDLNRHLQEIWDCRIVTNHGPQHQRFEAALRDYLQVPTAMAFNNGTTALLTTLRMFIDIIVWIFH